MISQQDQRAIAQAHAGDIGVQGLEAPDQLAAKRIAIETQVSVDVGRADMGSRYRYGSICQGVTLHFFTGCATWM